MPYRSLFTVGILAAIGARAAAEVRMQLSLIPCTEIVQRRLKSDVVGSDTIAIREGAPIALRLELINDSDQPSSPFLASLEPSVGLFALTMQLPDGSRVDLPAGRPGGRLTGVLPRVMKPHETIVLETWIYGRTVERNGAKPDLVYAFPQGGAYSIQAVYYSYADVAQSVDRRNAKPIRSNAVTVEVGPPIAGWSKLQDAKIVEMVETGAQSFSDDAVAEVLESVTQAEEAALQNWAAKTLREKRREKAAHPEASGSETRGRSK